MTAQAFNVQYIEVKQPVASKVTSLPPVESTNVPVLVKQV